MEKEIIEKLKMEEAAATAAREHDVLAKEFVNQRADFIREFEDAIRARFAELEDDIVSAFRALEDEFR